MVNKMEKYCRHLVRHMELKKKVCVGDGGCVALGTDRTSQGVCEGQDWTPGQW